MNKLNPGAFEFVPGKFKVPHQEPPQPSSQPVERAEQLEAPPPPPTISLNIGGSKPAPGTPTISASNPHVPATTKQSVVSKATPKPSASMHKTEPPSKTPSMEKSKTDTADIALEVQAVADRAVLEDLYGDGL